MAGRDTGDDLLAIPDSLGILDATVDRVLALSPVPPAGGTLIIVAADHPVTRHDISAYPAPVTADVFAAAERRVPVVLDGLVTSVAALVAVRAEPAVQSALVAGQCSRERAHQAVLGDLGLEPLLQLRLRSGEGVGACLAAQLLLTALRARQATARVVAEQRTED